MRKELTLPSPFSWETLIILSLFSYYMAILADSWVKHVLVNLGWIFLILGVYWATTSANQLRIGYKFPEKEGFPVSPWITGALVSIYIFGVLENRTGQITPGMLVYWPIFSAILAAIPEFLSVDFKLKSPPPNKRQNLVLLFTSQILLSCWFQFHFLVQDYVSQYPSVMADSFRNSAFVVKWESPLPSAPPRGALFLDTIGNQLRDQLNTKPWPEIERLLLDKERKKLIESATNRAKKQLSPTLEDDLWTINSNVSSKGSGYNLKLNALWQGPRATNQPKTLTKSCQITPFYPRASAATKPINGQSESAPISRVDCQEVRGWGIEPSILASE